MADGIERGIDKIAYVGDIPWHRYGEAVPELMSVTEAIAKIDYPVSKHELFLADGTKIDTHMATVRDDLNTVLGVVGSKYQVVQNTALDEFVTAVTRVGLRVDVVGTLFGGKKIWVTGSLPGDFFIGQDQIEKRLLFFNSHDGSMAVSGMVTGVRTVCNNTLQMAIKDGQNKFSIKHTINAMSEDNKAEARKVLGIADSFFRDFKELGDLLVKKEVDQDDVDRVMKALIPDKSEDENTKYSTRSDNIRDKISQLFQYGRGNDVPGIKGTAWAVYNGITEYADYYMTTRKTSGSEGDARLSSIWFGSAEKLKRKGLIEVSKLVGVELK